LHAWLRVLEWKRGGSASARDVIPRQRSMPADTPIFRQISLSVPASPLAAHTFHAGDRGFESRWGYAAVPDESRGCAGSDDPDRRVEGPSAPDLARARYCLSTG
jgi:hypothetical protein